MDPSQRMHAWISDKLLEDNFIVRRDGSNSCFYCFFCDCYIHDSGHIGPSQISEHINDPSHKRKKELPDRKSLTTENGIVAKATISYYCNWCKVKLPTYGQVKKHVAGEAHVAYKVKAQMQNMLKDNFIAPEESGPNDYYCYSCNTFIDVVLDHVSSSIHKTQLSKVLVENLIIHGASKKGKKRLYCLFCCCHFQVIFDHIISADHLINKNALDKNFLINDNNMSVTPASYFCNWCQAKLTTHGKIINHINMEEHSLNKERARLLETLAGNFITVENKDELENYYCHSCELHIDGSVFEHINSSGHITQMDKTLAQNFVIMDESNRYYCFFCDLHLNETLFNHIIKNKNHHTNKKSPKKISLISQNGLTSEGRFYVCNLCNIPLYSFPMVREHVRIKKHSFVRSNPVRDVQMLQTLAENFVVIAELRCRYYCFFCDSHFIVALDHIRGDTHRCNKESVEKRSLLNENSIISEPRSYYCCLCSVDLLTYKEITSHIERNRHKSAKLKQLMSQDGAEHGRIQQLTPKILEDGKSEHNALVEQNESESMEKNETDIAK